MIIFGQSAEKKREKEIRQDAKKLVKELANAGMDKGSAKKYMEMMQEILIAACSQRDGYLESRRRMLSGKKLIEEILDDIAEQDAEELKKQLVKLVAELSDVYHECTIRKDDMDFASTYTYIDKVSKIYDVSERLMLQSEMENLLHMVGEILEWSEPDFCALALFCKYGERNDLADIENNQRNQMMIQFYKGQFWDDFEENLVCIGMDRRIKLWIEDKIGS